ncbi:peptide-methionine (S)-S-oxide reductase MsrA [Xylophilus ampelinus]|uniref:Peptide methionine sulfoxide reductase MsrA n=1 Tax=Xylophilus ampelinus TaxID=54067 RepID=A0A318SI81_9BURK|nr:peptide-methionine (S)-S-oxide reductase MsrA [Xylophilus ampelinus]MCS4509881.1 peptide-methionine (S)-S-oxide reductase MsrA [Xylophilus ampelinus]PYE78570.1 peptide-methionine (S)-S-oxide reductase [Xylophilus ampelinus]
MPLPRHAKPATYRSARPGLAGSKSLVASGLIALAAWAYFGGSAAAAEKGVKLPAPTVDIPLVAAATPARTATAVFAGGCFWGVQAVFQHTRGVLNAVSGYAGGAAETARYEAIGSGRTGHAEAVKITYDPSSISYGRLLQVYFAVAHDPTQRDRQGPDTGTQYRSAIFYQDAEQKRIAEAYIAQLDAAHAFPARIVTVLSPVGQGFFPAEAYHQDYATRNPQSPYIARFDLPKLAELQTLMPEVYRATPVLVAQGV